VRRSTLLAPLSLLLLVPGHAARAEDAPGAAERRAKVEAARRALDEERRAFDEKVNQAIDRGVAWLRKRQKSTGNLPAFGDKLPPNTYNPMDLGVNALALLTLAKCGVPPEDPAFEKLKNWCLADYAKMKGLRKVMVYTASVLLLALDAAYNRGEREESEVARDRYGTTISRRKTPCRYPGPIASLVDELAKFLKGAQDRKSGGWRYPGNPVGAPPGDADVSNTQYALLGLNAAARCGTTVPVDTWMKAMEFLLREQEKDGLSGDLWVENAAWEPGLDDVPRWQSAGKRKARGWCYLPGQKDPATGSMTTAGLAGLAIVKERLLDAGKCPPDLARRIDTALLDGLVWLSEAFTVTDNPVMPSGGAPWHYYYLYGLERTGALTGARYLGRHDWYREGAAHLLAAQDPKDGGWAEAAAGGRTSDEHESAVTQTCFALLFLRRSTSPPVVPVQPTGLTGSDTAPR